MNNKYYAYDIEVYPNMFMVGFIDIYDEHDEFKVFKLIGGFEDDIKELKRFLNNNITLFGYNSYDYDDLVLRYTITTKNITNKEIYDFSKSIIEDDNEIKDTKFSLRNQKKQYKTCDLFRIGNFNIGYNFSSLKEIGIRLNHKNVIDLPYKPTKHLTPQEMIEVERYNINDVQITKKLFHELKGKYEMRLALGKEYNTNFLNSSDSNIGNKIVITMYATKTGRTHYDIKNIIPQNDQKRKIKVSDILHNIKFENENIEKFKNNLRKKIILTNTNYVINKDKITGNIQIDNNLMVNLGIGGLHSVDRPGIFCSDDNIRLIDLDVTSYYPNIILNYQIYPEHLEESLLEVIDSLTKQRIEAKKNKNKHKSDGLKIAINSIYGKFNFKNGWLFDIKCSLKVTLIGQFYLLKLIDMLYKDFDIISANTDGITCKVPVDEYDKFKNIYTKWEELSHFSLEETEYMKYIRRDVNNYIALKKSGDVKLKGIFVEKNLSKSINALIIRKALFQYFIHKIPVEKTIKNENNKIYDFLCYYKSNSQFKIFYNGKELQKTNRWYVSTKGKFLYKQRIDKLNVKTYGTPDICNEFSNNEKTKGQIIKLYGGDSAKLYNHIEHDDLPTDINYNFYITETRNIINSIESNNQQLILF